MVLDTTNFDGGHFVFPCDTAQIRPEPLLKSRRDYWPAVFGAKDTVMVGADIGHAHDSAVPSGLRQLRNRVPNLKRLGYCQFLPSGEEKAAHSGRIMLVADRIP